MKEISVCKICQLQKGIVCRKCKIKQDMNGFYKGYKTCKLCRKEEYKQKHPAKPKKIVQEVVKVVKVVEAVVEPNPIPEVETIQIFCECETGNKCNQCGKDKSASDYNKTRKICKDCRKEYNKQHYGLRKVAYDAVKIKKSKKMAVSQVENISQQIYFFL